MAERKTWIHGFYNNTFNASTQLWELRDSRNDKLMAEGPKADRLGKLGSAMTRQEKAWDKVRNMERQLELAKAAYGKAYNKMIDVQTHEYDAMRWNALLFNLVIPLSCTPPNSYQLLALSRVWGIGAIGALGAL